MSSESFTGFRGTPALAPHLGVPGEAPAEHNSEKTQSRAGQEERNPLNVTGLDVPASPTGHETQCFGLVIQGTLL